MQAICQLLDPHLVSLELTELEPEAIIRQAEELHALGDNAVIKVATGAISRSTVRWTRSRVSR
jgi:hypothetical protein